MALCPVASVKRQYQKYPSGAIVASHLFAVIQRVHGFEVAITRKAEGKSGKAFIGNMTEEKSVELASKMASESFLFVVSRRPPVRQASYSDTLPWGGALPQRCSVDAG